MSTNISEALDALAYARSMAKACEMTVAGLQSAEERSAIGEIAKALRYAVGEAEERVRALHQPPSHASTC